MDCRVKPGNDDHVLFALRVSSSRYRLASIRGRNDRCTVAAAVLGDIEPQIGALKHILYVAIAANRDGPPDADGDRNASLAMRDALGGDDLTQAIREIARGWFVSLAQQNDKFLAAEARDLVGAADRLRDQLSNALEHT